MIKKIFIIFILFLFIVLINNLCFASIDFTYNNTDNSMPNFPSPYDLRYQLLISDEPWYYFRYICSDSPISYRYDSYNIRLYLISDSTIYVSSRVHRSSSNLSNATWTSYTSNKYFFSPNKLAYANHLVSYVDNNNNEVILYQPPESYNNLPHILNDTQSLVIGGQSIVIQPRRLFKY